ncbi:MAG: pyridoxamine 5'-phosphate oxidase family protein [Yoonia sp.]|uniref:pyridoxamine 5'-phosphate oxidase family protein n=1 Tax=Yoonia sp. TaxID=2212373 RepID=UPI003EF46FD2
MKTVQDIDALEALYDTASGAALTKVVHRLTPQYAKWINTSRFVVLTTVGPEGTDGSPRGDIDPVVRIVDDNTLMLPDWRGNNRIDSLRNIVRDGRVSLMFMVPGSSNVIRVNGTAVLTDDETVTSTFEQKTMHPKSVIVITVGEAYFQCAKAIMRSELWTGDAVAGLPTAGELIKEQQAEFDAKGYDDAYPDYAKDRMW